MCLYPNWHGRTQSFVMATCALGVCHKEAEIKIIRPGKQRYRCGRRDKISSILHPCSSWNVSRSDRSSALPIWLICHTQVKISVTSFIYNIKEVFFVTWSEVTTHFFPVINIFRMTLSIVSNYVCVSSINLLIFVMGTWCFLCDRHTGPFENIKVC